MLTILLVIVVVLLLFGGFQGYRVGYVTPTNPIGLILIIVIILLLFGAFGYPYLYRY